MTRLVVVAVCVMLHLGCSDPVLRLADCVEGAVKAHARDGAATRASCDLGMPGSYLVVLHPAGELSDEQLVAAGVPQALLPELRTLRLGVNPALYVISTDPGVSGVGAERSVYSSRTTSQMHFVDIDRVMVLAKTAQPVTIEVGGPAGRPVIEGLQ